MIQAFLNDASKHQVEEEAAKLWLKNLENIAYEADDLLDEFNYEIIRRKVEIKNQMKRKVCFFFCFSNPLLFRSKLAHKIKNLNMKLKRANVEADSYLIRTTVANSTTSVPLVTETDSVTVDPIVIGREKDVSMIVDMLLNPNDEVVSVVPILGMGGLGKTTFARSIFNDQRTVKHFHKRIWMRVFSNEEEVSEHLKNIGREIARKCGGLPLAANMIGATLRRKDIHDWTSVLQSGFSDSNGNPIGIQQEAKKNKFGIIKHSKMHDFVHDLACSISKAESFNVENHKSDVPIPPQVRNLAIRSLDNHESYKMAIKENASYLRALFSNDKIPDGVLDDCKNLRTLALQKNTEELSPDGVLDDRKNLRTLALQKNTEELSPDGVLNDCKNLRTLALQKNTEELSPDGVLDDRKNLRTLALQKNTEELSPDGVLDDCKNLRTLALQKNTEELSPSIAKLIHLRFIDVSFTDIRAFPESICQLYNLQTLRAFRCFKLQELPSRFRNLISLRHLVVDREEHFEMPIEIGKLTCLRTLKFFNVGNENGRRIEELGYLKNLKGAVAIHKLEHVNGKEEAARACLIEKPNIHKLKFVWSGSREGNNFNDEQVLEGLEPPPSIKNLSIEGFSGDNLPSWIMNRSISDQVIRLEKLIELKLIGCERCLEIPTLGHLPLLKFLMLIGLGNVRSIGPLFYYPRNYDVNESRRRGNDQLAFPALERFIIQDMANLEKWTELSSTDSYQVVDAFPRLEYLEIDECPNISRFPSHGFPCLILRMLKEVEYYWIGYATTTTLPL
ncbi:UNVERIFIED_CONTAM: putative disease resistance protein RGA4 [Sesamum calycinum]|uniref:Disease resistance protein RGA4 n=1 Tax=Sesamum calycinum TaxID=2727403 RepID=A0AAW2SUV3_9LAMI